MVSTVTAPRQDKTPLSRGTTEMGTTPCLSSYVSFLSLSLWLIQVFLPPGSSLSLTCHKACVPAVKCFCWVFFSLKHPGHAVCEEPKVRACFACWIIRHSSALLCESPILCFLPLDRCSHAPASQTAALISDIEENDLLKGRTISDT